MNHLDYCTIVCHTDLRFPSSSTKAFKLQFRKFCIKVTIQENIIEGEFSFVDSEDGKISQLLMLLLSSNQHQLAETILLSRRQVGSKMNVFHSQHHYTPSLTASEIYVP